MIVPAAVLVVAHGSLELDLDLSSRLPSLVQKSHNNVFSRFTVMGGVVS